MVVMCVPELSSDPPETFTPLRVRRREDHTRDVLLRWVLLQDEDVEQRDEHRCYRNSQEHAQAAEYHPLTGVRLRGTSMARRELGWFAPEDRTGATRVPHDTEEESWDQRSMRS